MDETLKAGAWRRFGMITVSKLKMRPEASDWERVRCLDLICRSVTMVEFSKKRMISPKYLSGLEKSIFSNYYAAAWFVEVVAKKIFLGSVLPLAAGTMVWRG